MSDEKRIIVSVSGGLITDVSGVPPGVVVEVRDYDVEQGDIDMLNEHRKNERGEWYFFYEVNEVKP